MHGYVSRHAARGIVLCISQPNEEDIYVWNLHVSGFDEDTEAGRLLNEDLKVQFAVMFLAQLVIFGRALSFNEWSARAKRWCLLELTVTPSYFCRHGSHMGG